MPHQMEETFSRNLWILRLSTEDTVLVLPLLEFQEPGIRGQGWPHFLLFPRHTLEKIVFPFPLALCSARLGPQKGGTLPPTNAETIPIELENMKLAWTLWNAPVCESSSKEVHYCDAQGG